MNLTSQYQEAASAVCWDTVEITGDPDEVTYARAMYPANSYKEWTLTTPQSVAANTNTFITVGIDDFHHSSLDDMDSKQTMYNRWQVQEVQVLTKV